MTKAAFSVGDRVALALPFVVVNGVRIEQGEIGMCIGHRGPLELVEFDTDFGDPIVLELRPAEGRLVRDRGRGNR